MSKETEEDSRSNKGSWPKKKKKFLYLDRFVDYENSQQVINRGLTANIQTLTRRIWWVAAGVITVGICLIVIALR